MYHGCSMKNQIFRERVHEKPIYRGNCLKREEPGQFEDLREVFRKEGVVFLRTEIDTPMHAMSY